MVYMSPQTTHKVRMTDNQTHPYALEISESVRRPGSFEWTIRKHGKLIERSDRFSRSVDDAAKSGSKAVERLFASALS
jgi:hypothetical protein